MTEATGCSHGPESATVADIITNVWYENITDGSGMSHINRKHERRTRIVCLECGATNAPTGAMY